MLAGELGEIEKSNIHDMEFINNMSQYREHDDQIANNIIIFVKRHLWNLTEKVIVFSIFYDSVSSSIRSQIATKFFNETREEALRPEKPKFPLMDDNIPELLCLIGPCSLLLFNLLCPNSRHEWMQLPTQYWPLMEDFRTIKNFVLNVEVVNDCTERGIHLITEFKNATLDNNQHENLFQVVENHRKKVNSLKKTALIGN